MEKVTAEFRRRFSSKWEDAASLFSTGEFVLNQTVGQSNDERQILALHEAGDRALMSADLTVLARIFADDYVQYNEEGKAFTKSDVLENFRTGAIRYPSIVSTGRKIRIFGDTAVVYGSESDEVESGGKRFSVRYVYLDVLLKRDGEWKLVASQLARRTE
jgi:ketosteroid isomerase-like protein